MIRFFNDGVKRMNIYDLKLIQGSAMMLGLILVKIYPEILTISIWWFVGLAIAMLPRPFYVFFIQRTGITPVSKREGLTRF